MFILKWVLHDWSDNEAISILKRCHESLKSGNKILVIETIIGTETDHFLNHYLDFIMMTIFGGKERTLDEFKHLFSLSGFSINRVIETGTLFKIMEIVKI